MTRHFALINTLISTEDMQNNIDRVAEFCGDNVDEWNPIVAVEGKIIDGHNRVAYASSIGADRIPAESISRGAYEHLQNAGFDNIEIAFAVLWNAEEYDAATAVSNQFPGAGVAVRGREAALILDENYNVEPTDT